MMKIKIRQSKENEEDVLEVGLKKNAGGVTLMAFDSEGESWNIITLIPNEPLCLHKGIHAIPGLMLDKEKRIATERIE